MCNLACRTDNRKNLKETFTYDDMNRLTGITLKRSPEQNLYCSVVYDALGCMTSRETVTYPGFDKASKVKQGADSP